MNSPITVLMYMYHLFFTIAIHHPIQTVLIIFIVYLIGKGLDIRNSIRAN